LNTFSLKDVMKIYRHSTPVDIQQSEDEEDTSIGCPPNGIFQGLPPSDPIHVLVRVYIVKVKFKGMINMKFCNNIAIDSRV